MHISGVVIALLATTFVLMAIRRFRRARSSGRPVKRRNMGPIALAFGMAFSSVLDPARKASVEELGRREELGDQEKDWSGSR